MSPFQADRYSPAAQRVLRRGWAIARDRGIEEVPLDTLIIALREEDGLARELLEQVDLHEKAPTLREMLPPLPPKRMFAPEVVTLLDEADSWVRELGPHLTIGSEHLLYGALVVDAGLRSECEEAGLTLQTLREKLQVLSGFTAEPLDANLELSVTVLPSDDGAISLRIIDASLNRAGEGLRVVEDYLRFGLDDAALSEQCKKIRHSLQPVARRLSIEARTAVRDVAGDVGTEISLTSEQSRGSAVDVAAANLSRAAESLRSAEEYAKTQDHEVAAMLEQARYQTYTLEKALTRCLEARRRLGSTRLLLLLSTTGLNYSFETVAEAALAGGVDAIQLRDKSLSDRRLLEAAQQLRTMTREAGALFFVNDRPDIAVLADADGVHVGQDDLTVSDVRRIIGSERLIGLSTHCDEDADRARYLGVDYIGAGPTFPSQTKSFENYAGLKYLESVATRHRCPIFAIGGINETNAERVVATGISRLAVSHAITHADQPEFVARTLKACLERGCEVTPSA